MECSPDSNKWKRCDNALKERNYDTKWWNPGEGCYKCPFVLNQESLTCNSGLAMGGKDKGINPTEKWTHCNNSLINSRNDYSKSWWDPEKGCNGCPFVHPNYRLDDHQIYSDYMTKNKVDGQPCTIRSQCDVDTGSDCKNGICFTNPKETTEPISDTDIPQGRTGFDAWAITD